jgi:hypothetical protein
MEDETRRSLFKKTALAAGFLNLNPRVRGANEKVVLALVGGRNQGGDDAVRAIQQGAEIKTFCDIDQAILDKIGPKLEKAQQKAPGTTKEFRRVLDDRDIDGLIIATPDHWHANLTMLACQAGKDVYIEKPMTHTIHEGQLVRDAARKYKRVVQVGTQMRSIPHYATAIDYVKSGKLGKICKIGVWECQVRSSIGNPPDSNPPATVDYDVWLGPAPETVQRKPVPLQLEILLGLLQYGAGKPGRTLAGHRDVGNSEPARRGQLSAHASFGKLGHLLASRCEGSSRHANHHVRLRRFYADLGFAQLC